MTVKIQLRRGTAEQWTSANPTLLSGEQGLETDTSKTKIGDGVTAWNSLGYVDAKFLATSASSSFVSKVIVDAKGDLIAGTADNTIGLTINSPVILGPEERCNIVASAATGTINFDVLTATIWYYTSNATANHTLNFRGNSGTTLTSILAVGDSISAIWLNTNGATPYSPTVFQIDGSAVTPTWAGGTAPSAGNASSIDAYSFSIIKTAATPTYVVLAGQTRFA